MSNSPLQLSVIIPVFNAAQFVRKAVESALAQQETAEVLLIEDGSSDNSLEICEQLDAEYGNVRLFIHEGNDNRGAGASRNVGVENAKFDYIAFLDADDFYLPERFRAERRIFAEHPDADGVYGALGFHFYSERGRKRFRDAGYSDLTSVRDFLEPDALFEGLIGLEGYVGGFSLDALTIATRRARSVRGFPDFSLHEDTHFIFKLAICGRLHPGIIDEPVAMRGVHDSNRIVRNTARSDSYVRMYSSLLEWAIANGVSDAKVQMITARLELARLRQRPYFWRPLMLAAFCIRHPSRCQWKNYRGESLRALVPDAARVIKRRIVD